MSNKPDEFDRMAQRNMLFDQKIKEERLKDEKSKEDYWSLTVEERKERDKVEAEASKPKERYYLWTYCKSYGWRQMGRTDGYETVDALIKEEDYYFNDTSEDIKMIMKSTVFLLGGTQ